MGFLHFHDHVGNPVHLFDGGKHHSTRGPVIIVVKPAAVSAASL
jgi:hypothetical protein